MKEICSNFICQTSKCPAAEQQKACRTTAQTPAAEAAAILPDTGMGDCNACVTKKIGLAQAFVPNQPYAAPMEGEQSLVCGTAFSALVMPYCAGWNIARFGKEV